MTPKIKLNELLHLQPDQISQTYGCPDSVASDLLEAATKNWKAWSCEERKLRYSRGRFYIRDAQNQIAQCFCKRSPVSTHIGTGWQFEEDRFIAGSCDLCRIAARWQKSGELVFDFVPESLQHLRLAWLTHNPRSPISAKAYEEALSMVDTLAWDIFQENVKHVIFCGPPGCGKTVLASAICRDLMRFSKMKDSWGNKLLPSVRRVDVRPWIKAIQEFENFSFGENRPRKPEVNVDWVLHAYSYPIVWLEEIDKVQITPDRHDILFDLLNAIEKKGGAVITTTNLTLSELEEKLGEASFRRIAGTANATKPVIVDFYALAH